MDASQYLRRLKESCTQTLGRAKCMEAGLRTHIVRNAALTTYVPPAQAKSQSGIAPVNECCLKPLPGYDGAVTPVQPPAGCVSAAACNDLANRYAAPIELPGCPIPYAPPAYVSADSYKYQGTREQTSEAVRLRGCTDCTPPLPPPTEGCLNFTKGILRIPMVNGFNLGTGAFTVEWFQKLAPLANFTSEDTYYYTLFSIGDLAAETEAMAFYYQVSPPNPVTVYSVYASRGSAFAPFYFGDFGTVPPDELAYTDVTDAWVHVALVGDGAVPASTNTIRMYVNGMQFGSAFSDYNFSVGAQPYLSIGGQYPLNTQNYYNGCMTNFRWSKGEALYTGNFVPPTSPLAARASTQLLLSTMSDAPASDSSTPAKSITPIGGVQFIGDTPF
jgi:hypothetical protein